MSDPFDALPDAEGEETVKDPFDALEDADLPDVGIADRDVYRLAMEHKDKAPVGQVFPYEEDPLGKLQSQATGMVAGLPFAKQVSAGSGAVYDYLKGKDFGKSYNERYAKWDPERQPHPELYEGARAASALGTAIADPTKGAVGRLASGGVQGGAYEASGGKPEEFGQRFTKGFGEGMAGESFGIGSGKVLQYLTGGMKKGGQTALAKSAGGTKKQREVLESYKASDPSEFDAAPQEMGEFMYKEGIAKPLGSVRGIKERAEGVLEDTWAQMADVMTKADQEIPDGIVNYRNLAERVRNTAETDFDSPGADSVRQLLHKEADKIEKYGDKFSGGTGFIPMKVAQKWRNDYKWYDVPTGDFKKISPQAQVQNRMKLMTGESMTEGLDDFYGRSAKSPVASKAYKEAEKALKDIDDQISAAKDHYRIMLDETDIPDEALGALGKRDLKSSEEQLDLMEKARGDLVSEIKKRGLDDATLYGGGGVLVSGTQLNSSMQKYPVAWIRNKIEALNDAEASLTTTGRVDDDIARQLWEQFSISVDGMPPMELRRTVIELGKKYRPLQKPLEEWGQRYSEAVKDYKKTKELAYTAKHLPGEKARLQSQMGEQAKFRDVRGEMPLGPEQFDDLKQRYRMGKLVQERASDQASREAKNRAFGLTEQLGFGTGALLGDIETAVAFSMAANQARRTGWQSGGVTMRFIADALEMSPGLFGKYAPELQAAAKRGPQAIAATHYILLKKFPEYKATLDYIPNKLQSLLPKEGQANEQQ